MATYRKQKTIRPQASQQAENIVNKLDKNASKAEQFLEKYKKHISLSLAAVVVVLIAIWGYHTWIVLPSEAEATEELAFAQKAYEQDSLALALDGDPAHLGLVKIADQYSSTPAGNIAKYLAGAAYYKQGQYDLAISYLKSYSSDDEITAAEALGLIGDCYAQQEKPSEALSYYAKAAAARDNDFTAPFYLMKAGNVAMHLKQYSEAVKYYEKIKNDYPQSAQAAQIDSHLEYARGAAKNL